jgi:hypothetical protein
MVAAIAGAVIAFLALPRIRLPTVLVMGWALRHAACIEVAELRPEEVEFTSQRERRLLALPPTLDFEVLRFTRAPLPVRLLAAAFRVAAREPVLFVLVRFAFPRLVADFLVALRLEAAADRLPPAERFVLPRLLAAPLDVAFFLVERLLPRRGFFRSPVRTSTNELTALFATSTAAFTLALAASPIASLALGVRVPSLPLPPSVSFSIVHLLVLV